MAKKILIGVAIVLIVGTFAALLFWGPPRTELTEEMKRDFGAAAFVPEDVSSYASLMHLGRKWEEVWNSHAVRQIVELPKVQEAWQRLQKSDAYHQMMWQIRMNPVLSEAVPILKDAVSNEMFFCAGPELPDFMEAARGPTSALIAMLGSLAGPTALTLALPGPVLARPPDPAPLVDEILANKEELRVPSVLLGFKLTDTEAAEQFLEKWLSGVPPLPVGRIDRETIGGVTFYVLTLGGDDIPRDALDELAGRLFLRGVTRRKTRELTEWIRDLRLAVAVGVLDDYLMVSVGHDTSLPARWGQGPSLAASAGFEPLRKRYKPGLLSISYVSAKLHGASEWTTENIEDRLREAADSVSEADAPVGLRARLKRDAARLADDMRKYVPEPADTLAFTFENQGLESYAFSPAAEIELDDSDPLSILAHRGENPILAVATRGVKDPHKFDLFAKWFGTAVDYFEDFVVAEFDRDNRVSYRMTMEVIRPFARSVSQTTRDHLVPAVSGGQSLLVIDGEGALSRLPEHGRLPVPIPVPRLGMVVELTDADAFKKAVEGYADAVEALLQEIREAAGAEARGLRLPRHQTEELEEGTLYFYRLPWDLGRDVLPCALLKEKRLVLGSSRRLVTELAEPAELPAGDVVELGEDAGRVVMVDFTAGWSLLDRVTRSLVQLTTEFGDFSRRQRQEVIEVRQVLETVWRSLGAVRSYHSRTARAEDGRLMTHSWLHVKDVSP